MTTLSPEELRELQNYLTPRERVNLARLTAAKLSLHDFIREFWSVVEPANPFIDNWHIGAIAEHLEACTFGEIRNMIVNVPPGTMKSLTVNVFWPAWEWIFAPQTQWIFGSYAESLALRDSMKCRRLIKSPEYQEQFGKSYALRQDMDTKGKFETSAGGHRLAVGIGGQGTGERADRIVVDDPIKAADSDSAKELENASLWWFETMSSRDRDMTTSSRVIIMQRLSDKDLTGEVLSRDLGYEHIRLPMRYDKDLRLPPTKLGFEDPRTTDGELLFPARMPEAEVKRLEANLGSFGTAGQLQQTPVARGGNFIKRDWYEPPIPFIDPSQIQAKCIYFDLGFSGEETADFTAGTVVAKLTDGSALILNQYAGQWGLKERNENIQRYCLAWNAHFPGIPVYIEGGIGAGVSGTEDLRNTLLSIGIKAYLDPPRQSKFERASSSFFPASEVKRIKLYSGSAYKGFENSDWIDAMLKEWASLRLKQTAHGIEFVGAHDDRLDSAVGAYNKLTAPQPSYGRLA